MRRVFLLLAAAAVTIWLYRRGSFDGVSILTVAAVAVGLAITGGILGALVGAGHARERRAWGDYQTQRSAVPVARRAWLAALGESLRRMVLPLLLAAGAAFLLWKGRH